MNFKNLREQRFEELRQLRERQRAHTPKTLREFQHAEDEREREQRERPIREAEAALQATAREFGLLTRENVESGRDPEVYIAPEVSTIRMTEAEANRFNGQAANEFLANCPEYYRCPENLAALFGYFARNGIQIMTAEMLKRAFNRLREFGLIKERPESETISAAPEVQAAPAEESKQDAGSMEGFDLETGQPRRYTAFEIERLSGDQFKRAFRITREQQTLARRNW